MKVKCIKDVVMDDGTIDFYEGKVYEASVSPMGEISAIDEEGYKHWIRGERLSGFYKEHFIQIPETKTKYVHLYNLTEEYFDIQGKNKILKVIPEAKIINEQIMMGRSYKGESIWIPEDKFLIAWTIFNYESLLRINFDGWESELEADDGVEWFERHRNNPSLVRYL